MKHTSIIILISIIVVLVAIGIALTIWFTVSPPWVKKSQQPSPTTSPSLSPSQNPTRKKKKKSGGNGNGNGNRRKPRPPSPPSPPSPQSQLCSQDCYKLSTDLRYPDYGDCTRYPPYPPSVGVPCVCDSDNDQWCYDAKGGTGYECCKGGTKPPHSKKPGDPTGPPRCVNTYPPCPTYTNPPSS